MHKVNKVFFVRDKPIKKYSLLVIKIIMNVSARYQHFGTNVFLRKDAHFDALKKKERLF
jgi:hypothetical protein